MFQFHHEFDLDFETEAGLSVVIEGCLRAVIEYDQDGYAVVAVEVSHRAGSPVAGIRPVVWSRIPVENFLDAALLMHITQYLQTPAMRKKLDAAYRDEMAEFADDLAAVEAVFRNDLRAA